MTKFILGILVGIALTIFLLLTGGGKYLADLGSKTEKAGVNIVEYEKELKEKISQAKKKVSEKKETLKKSIKEKKEQVKKIVE